MKDKKGREAFNRELGDLYSNKKQQLKNWVMRFVHRPQDVEDIVQEAFLRTYQVQMDKPIDNPTGYLFQAAKNLSFKSNAKFDHKLTDYIADLDLPGVSMDTDPVIASLEAHEQFSLFCRAVRDLPVQCRRVFILRKVYDLSHAEIAERLGISVSTSHQHLAKGLARCTAFMKDEGLLEQINGTQKPADTGK
jgi:RNA polymerase sigma factor (sigma-70 family)